MYSGGRDSDDGGQWVDGDGPPVDSALSSATNMPRDFPRLFGGDPQPDAVRAALRARLLARKSYRIPRFRDKMGVETKTSKVKVVVIGAVVLAGTVVVWRAVRRRRRG